MLLASHHLQVQPAGWEDTALDALLHSVIACKHEKMVRRVDVLTSGTVWWKKNADVSSALSEQHLRPVETEQSKRQV